MTSAVGRAQTLVDNGRWADALGQLGPHIASEPGDEAGWCLVAQCHLGLDDPAKALDAAGTAAALAPDSDTPYRLLSMALAALKRHGEARWAADEAIRMDPQYWLNYYQRAEADVACDYVDEDTWTMARTAVDLAPHEASAHNTLGRVALVAKKNRVAAQAFCEALRLDPHSIAAQNNLAVTALRRYRFGRAASLLTAVLRANPNSKLYAQNLRFVLQGWVTVLNALAVIGSVIVLNFTGRHADERPTVLVVVTAIVAAFFVLAVLTIRSSIGSRAGLIFAASLRVDRVLLLVVAGCLAVVCLLAAATVVGLPTARPILYLALAVSFTTGMSTRWIRRRRRRTG